MKSARVLLAGVFTVTIAIPAQAQEGGLNYTTEQLQLCQQQLGKRKPDEIRQAIERNDLAGALAKLPKPGKNGSARDNYVYGKVLYLQAYEPVTTHRLEKPDPELLAKAVELIGAAAKQGDAEALFDQAMLLTPLEQAEQRLILLKQAADKQYVPAMLQLAEEYFLTSESYERRAEAQALVQKAAEFDTGAKIKLAEYYLHLDKRFTNTTGYDFDVEKAIRFFYEVAVACDGRGAYRLYEMAAEKHKPNSLDPSTAINWLTVAAELDLPKAQGQLAEFHAKDSNRIKQAILWGERAVENGDITGMIVLGNIYYFGKGVEADHSKALQYFERALARDQDNRFVQDQLGMMYYKGEGAQVDFRRAAELCKLAANKGQPGCQYYLGLMYVNGEGVTQDIDQGISWMRKSAAQDFAIAKNWLRENW